jgi:hypothetical protein
MAKMIYPIPADPSRADEELEALLATPHAWLVVFGDPALAQLALEACGDEMDLRNVCLASPAGRTWTSIDGRGSPLAPWADVRAVAVSARSGRVVDVIRGTGPISTTRIELALVRAESE